MTRKNCIALVSLAVVGLVAVAGCGKPNKAAGGGGAGGEVGTTSVTSAALPKGGSCNVEKQGICEEYADTALGLAEGACKSLMKGTYAKASCSTQNLMGVCETQSEKKFYYFGNALAPWVSDAKQDCEKSSSLTPGKFTAQPNAEEAAKNKALPSADKISASCAYSDHCEDIIIDALDMEKSSCESTQGKYSTSACPTAGLVASCVQRGKVVRHYEKALKTSKMSTLQATCDSSGLFFGHFYPDPNAPVAAAGKGASKAKGKKK